MFRNDCAHVQSASSEMYKNFFFQFGHFVVTFIKKETNIRTIKTTQYNYINIDVVKDDNYMI
jgi:hypothetical protein